MNINPEIFIKDFTFRKKKIGKFQSRAIWLPQISFDKKAPTIILIPGSGANGPECMIPGCYTTNKENYPFLNNLAKPFYQAGFHTLTLGKPGVDYFSGWDEEKHWDTLDSIPGLYAGASERSGADNAFALAATYNDPVNPYYGKTELLYRAAAAALRDLMVLGGHNKYVIRQGHKLAEQLRQKRPEKSGPGEQDRCRLAGSTGQPQDGPREHSRHGVG